MMENYVFLMSVSNGIEANNVAEVLEAEDIKVKIKPPAGMEFTNIVKDELSCKDIYVLNYAYEKARQVVEVEITRGDF